MPGRLKVRILSARDLPVMDRASELTDAFVEVRFGSETYKTDVCKKSLHPQWNSDWFRFEVDDEVLQDEPLDLRVLDYDTYSAHDAIGKVYIDLNPLLNRETPNTISGWFPIYDTMHGIRGELNVQVRVELFSDFNKFRQSSCGIQFFCTSEVPSGWRVQHMLGFIEELVVNDDPEYQWIEKIRTPRASNEARQRLFSKLSGELQRKLGVKVLELGGNAVLGYHQNFDLEGESGIIVRAIGTAVALTRGQPCQGSPGGPAVSPRGDSVEDPAAPPTSPPPNVPGTPADTHSQRNSTSPMRVTGSADSNRRNSDSDLNNTPSKGSLSGSANNSNIAVNTVAPPRTPYAKPPVVPPSVELLEYPFFTMRKFPQGFIKCLGGVVSARSVKLLDKIHNPEEPETRDAWWGELRTEVKAHAAKLGCTAVIGYAEQTSICDEVIVLSAMGTAAKINMTFDPSRANVSTGQDKPSTGSGSEPRDKHLTVDISLANQGHSRSIDLADDGQYLCCLCHIPYSPSSLPFDIQLSRCAMCRGHSVPEVLFTTVDPPAGMPVLSKCYLIQARICRPKSKSKSSEHSAREVSDSLPFVEYEVHNQLINKLKIRGLNCLFGLKIQISLGDNMLVALATATGAFVAPLPAPPLPRISSEVATEEESQDMTMLQRKINRTVQIHRERLQNEMGDHQIESSQGAPLTDEDISDGEGDVEGGDNTFVLMIDDLKDDSVEMILQDFHPPEGFYICNTQTPPGFTGDQITANLQMFTQMTSVRFQPSTNTNLDFSAVFNTILRRICFKLRALKPCCLADISFTVDLPDEDEINIAVTGCCLGVQGSPSLPSSVTSSTSKLLARDGGKAVGQTDDMMFPLEGVGDPPSATSAPPTSAPPTSPPTDKMSTDPQSKGGPTGGPTATQMGRSFKKLKEASRPRQTNPCGIELTPLNVVHNGRVDRYLGYYNFFFIRESTAVRECGGLGGFMHSFIQEVTAIVRAHVAALGGNALTAFNMWQCVLDSNPHKNQGQCLINVSGDIVVVSHDLGPDSEGDVVFTETSVPIPVYY